jgi:quercetin dioxygenase-like cupin family protein
VASTKSDGLRIDPKHFRLEFENSQVRVLRVKMGPGESLPMHESALNRLVVYITDANIRDTTAGGNAEVVQHKAAEFTWSGPAKHRVENLSDKPFEAVIVEFKS